MTIVAIFGEDMSAFHLPTSCGFHRKETCGFHRFPQKGNLHGLEGAFLVSSAAFGDVSGDMQWHAPSCSLQGQKDWEVEELELVNELLHQVSKLYPLTFSYHILAWSEVNHVMLPGGSFCLQPVILFSFIYLLNSHWNPHFLLCSAVQVAGFVFS